jgi:hypothetical protein
MTVSSNCALRLPGPLRTLDFFAERAARGNVEVALEIMNRPGSEPPRKDDNLVGS